MKNTEPVEHDEKKVDSLLNIYLKEEGIDKSYTNLILQELYDATELTNDQINMAANELLNSASTENVSDNHLFQTNQDEKSHDYF